MKVLFIVQGEGRGHLTQALTMEDMLRRSGHKVVEVLVGKSGARRLPSFFEKGMKPKVSMFDSPNFLPTPANKRNSLTRSVVYNVIKSPAYMKSILLIRRKIEESGADLVINFYELLTGLTYLLFRPAVPQVSIGHQYLFLHSKFDFPKGSPASLFFLKMFTRITSIGAEEMLALSFHDMESDPAHGVTVVPPLLRREVLATRPTDGDYIHGYMVNSGFGKSIAEWHKGHPETNLHFFWDKKGAPEVTVVDNHLSFHYIDDKAFLRSLAGCKAYATTAGFESVCEAMYFGKPVLMVPAHIEQDCNAHDAQRCGAGISSVDFDLSRLSEFAESYRPDTSFRTWAGCARTRIMSRLEKAAASVPARHLSLSTLESVFYS